MFPSSTTDLKRFHHSRRCLLSAVVLLGFATAPSTLFAGEVAEPSQASSPDHTLIVRSSQAAKRPEGMTSSESTAGWWFGTAGIALVLVGCGAVCLAARKFLPQSTSPLLKVVGRVSLSPKHSVYLLRVEGRVLLIGAGPQGAPSYLGELGETNPVEEALAAVPQIQETAPPTRPQFASAKSRAPRTVASAVKGRFDVQVGDDE